MEDEYRQAGGQDNKRGDLVAKAPPSQLTVGIRLAVIDLPSQKHNANPERNRENGHSDQLQEQHNAVGARSPIPRDIGVCAVWQLRVHAQL